jgi:HPt (histidine-containing phosphotransfer) domain-containing protein
MTDPFDPALLDAVVGGDASIARELVEEFLPSARSDVSAIRQAAADSLLQDVKSASHRLKGSAALIGARELIALCTELQLAAMREDEGLVAALAPRLEICLGKIETALGQFLEQTA